MTRRTSAYLFTTEKLADVDMDMVRRDARIKTLLQRARELRFESDTGKVVPFRTSYRIVVRGRLGKNNPNAHLYRQGGPLKRYSSQEIRHEHSQRFDVYLREVRTYR